MESKVIAIISQVTGAPLESIDLDTSTDNLDTWDSVVHLGLVMALEEEFGVQFSEEQIVEMFNVALIIEALKECGIQP